MDREVRKKRPPDPRSRKNAGARTPSCAPPAWWTNDVQHAVPADQRRCPYCESSKLKPVGQGKESFVWDYVRGYFRRQRHVRETLACTCGQYIVTAPGPDHSVESTRYGDGLRAYIVTSKCADSLPLYRLAKQFAAWAFPLRAARLLTCSIRWLGNWRPCRRGWCNWWRLRRLSSPTKRPENAASR